MPARSLCRRSLCRTTQLQRASRSRRLIRPGLDRIDPPSFDRRGLDARKHFHRACTIGAQRTRMRARARHQHLRSTLMTEVAIGETHARNRSSEAALVQLVEVEAGLERKPPQRGANRLPAYLQRVAGQAQVTNGTGAAELHGASRAHVIEYPPGSPRAVKAGEGEYLSGYEPAGFLGTHRPSKGGRDRRTGHNRSQHKTRNHAVTP